MSDEWFQHCIHSTFIIQHSTLRSISVLHMEEFIILADVLQDMVEMVAVGVRDEDLSIVRAGHEFDDLLHPAGVELVKDVVEKQQRRGA